MRVPVVLMYHDVSVGGDMYTLAPARFREHLSMVGRSGAPVVTARDLPSIDGRAVCITFDDGTRGVVEHGLPTLAEAGLTATLFMTASAIGTEGWCSARDLRAWCEAGHELGSHGHLHESLTAMLLENALQDLARSKTVLEDTVGQPVRTLSFPNGRLTPALVDGARELGLTPVFGSWPGYGPGRSGAYGRFAILDRTSDRVLRAVLEGQGAIAFTPQRALFLLGRAVGERNYVKLHGVLRRARRGA